MRSWIHHAKARHVRQARVGSGDLPAEHISRQGYRSGAIRNTIPWRVRWA